MTRHAEEVARWLLAARAGSAEALGEALEACRGYLLLIAQEELQTDLQAKGGASDLVQETFLKAHRHFNQFHGSAEEELLAWLRRLLLNNLIDFRRHYQSSEKRKAAREVKLRDNDSTAHGIGWLADSGLSPSGIVQEDEQRAAVQQAVARLPEDYRQVLALRYQEDRPYDEIGKLMGRSENAVRKLCVRALERLQQEWEQNEDQSCELSS
jgi:RNA polymerase sigma-70 factor (ECF subfamily)